MSLEIWSAVDDYFGGLLLRDDPSFDFALASSAAAGLPPIQVSPMQGKLLQLLAQAQGARKILEIGTLGGYSTLWLARALPGGGSLVTLEYEPMYADVARRNLARAGFSEAAEVVTGDAKQTLPRLADGGRGPFDFIFIDADKSGYPEYFTWALRLSAPGSLIVADNVVRNGAVVDATTREAYVVGIRRMSELVAAEKRVSATVVQTVGCKGYDGLMIARVVG